MEELLTQQQLEARLGHQIRKFEPTRLPPEAQVVPLSELTLQHLPEGQHRWIAYYSEHEIGGLVICRKLFDPLGMPNHTKLAQQMRFMDLETGEWTCYGGVMKVTPEGSMNVRKFIGFSQNLQRPYNTGNEQVDILQAWDAAKLVSQYTDVCIFVPKK